MLLGCFAALHSPEEERENKNMVIGSIQPRSQQTYQQDDAGSPGAAPDSRPAGYIPTNDNTYLTALVASSAAVPIVAAMITVAVYVARFSATWHLWLAVPLGAIITAIAWLLFAIPCRRFASADPLPPLRLCGLRKPVQLWQSDQPVTRFEGAAECPGWQCICTSDRYL